MSAGKDLKKNQVQRETADCLDSRQCCSMCHDGGWLTVCVFPGHFLWLKLKKTMLLNYNNTPQHVAACVLFPISFFVVIEHNLSSKSQTFSHHCQGDKLLVLSHILWAVVPVTVNVGALQLLNSVTLFSGRSMHHSQQPHAVWAIITERCRCSQRTQALLTQSMHCFNNQRCSLPPFPLCLFLANPHV